MAIDVVIKQKLFGGKTMPLEVILGDELHYGNFVNDRLNAGELGASEFVAYHPGHIGRGFSVVWTPGEKKRIALRLPQPSTAQELADFYAAVERMASYWDARLIVDGRRIGLSGFLAGLKDVADFNDQVIRSFSRQVLDGAQDYLTLYSAMWPLTMGREEAAAFSENPDRYSAWLHERQSVDACFAVPAFYAGEQGIFARFTLVSGQPAILPEQPTVPFGAIDPATGKQLECTQWLICLWIQGGDQPLCEMEYARFRSLLPKEKTARYDGNHFLLSALTEAEIKTLAGG